MIDRDRDAAGRPRNARPRDTYGRPLPHGSAGVERVPDDLTLTPAQAVELAEERLRADQPFAAHEILEAMWKAADPKERDLWQGLAQIAVGLTHVQRGNAVGARTLLLRGADRIAAYAAASPHALPVEAIARRAAELATEVAERGCSAIGSAPLSLRRPEPLIE